MTKFNELLNLRFKKKEITPKMTALAEKSTSGNLSSFSGVFRVTSLSDNEKDVLENILSNYKDDSLESIEDDFLQLVSITSEVKAITNQAVMLHGERIQKAQVLLKNYKEGAFTSWLMSVYGNRQTPYNFLKYYEFYTSMPDELRQKIDAMPRQAIYTLASRDGDVKQKKEIVEKYEGQAKNELLSLIRKAFPLQEQDRRNTNIFSNIIQNLKSVKNSMMQRNIELNDTEKKQISKLLSEIKNLFK